MSNFLFLKTEFPEIFAEAVEAEKNTLTSPRFGGLLCRSALEKAVHWLYANDSDLHEPYENKLASLISAPCFQEILKPSMYREINAIRINGNNAAHGKNVTQAEALASLKYLFRFTSFLSKYYSEQNPDIPPFDETLIPDGRLHEKSLKELQEKAAELAIQTEELQKERAEREKQAQQMELLRLQFDKQLETIAVRKEERRRTIDLNKAIPMLLPESATRKIYIDLLLKEAGWETLRPGHELEYELSGMPLSTNPSGKGFADYVLWGNNGLPLAVIEAKKTMVNSHAGQHQAELYANCLEKQFGQRPIIFYSNGFETYLWDDTFYPERQVHGFYTKEELQLLIDRRKTRTDLRRFNVNPNIAGRPYQLQAIVRVAEAFVSLKDNKLKGRSRKALLVMATGSGKTRVSAALVDMLTKCNWAKRILFLADRNALVTQAKNAFNEHLPQLSSIDLTKEKEDKGTRVVFSTYPTIMNKIDSLKTNDNRFYGVGHFDVIIIDEAHRSVYQKYKAIFDYFDALLIGLTATPKNDVDRNTYSLFDIEDDNPTFAYELNQAVNDKYLVPPRAISVPIKFPRQGIHYHDLSESEKAEYEEKFGDPTKGEADDEIESSALNTWLFNTDTVDKVLDHLMTHGIKTAGGDQLGKTIIFAKNHTHALFIQDRFNKNYPEYAGKFLRVIDNYEPKAQELLETFCDKTAETYPQIAVSVDMMDTGVDAIRVVNLVFFKMVKSASKFWQMIGRGTRLCPNLFGPGDDKKHFIIFDFCENFEFFEEFPGGITTGSGKSISQQIFEAKLEVAFQLRSLEEPSSEDLQLAESYIDELHQKIASLDHERFQVRKELRLVNEYTHKLRWQNLSRGDVFDICCHLSHLPAVTQNNDEAAKRFDMLMLNLQLAYLLNKHKQVTYIQRVDRISKALLKKQNIPAVSDKLPLLKSLQTNEFWQNISCTSLENVRCEIRDLIKFLDRDTRFDVYTHFEDELNLEGVQEKDLIPTYTSMQAYRDRVESYIRKNKDHLVIHKIQSNQPITKDELALLEKLLFEGELGTKADYQREYGDKPLGTFIRSLLGLDREVANALFAEFIQAGNLRADQITFINQIIDFLTVNGEIEKTLLFEPPFTNKNDQGITGLFDDALVGKIIRIIDQVNENAVG